MSFAGPAVASAASNPSIWSSLLQAAPSILGSLAGGANGAQQGPTSLVPQQNSMAAALSKISQSMPINTPALNTLTPPSFMERFAKGYQELQANPMFKLSMGLLEQGGPQMKPHSFGQDLSRAVRGVQDDQDADLVRQQNQMKVQQMKDANSVAMKWFQDNYGNYNGGMSSGQQPLTPSPVRIGTTR